jgi:DNA-binding transcriptional LysR family regulator
MQFEALKVFCDVARSRSFSQAALANDLTQPAVSRIVLELEKRLRVQLVNRATRPLQLTEAGQTYYEGCKALLEQYGELEARIRQAEMAVEVQVAAIYSVGLGDMGHFVERFASFHPRARVQVEYLHPDRVYEKVLDGTVDFGLVSFPRKSRELTILAWREEEMVLACAPKHPLAQQRAIRTEQLQRVKYIGFNKELTIRREIDRFLREQGITVKVVLEFDNIENIKKAIEIAAGVALLPEPTLRSEVQAGTLVARPLAGCRMIRPLGILCARQHPLSSAAQRFIDLLRGIGHNGCADTYPNGTANGRPRPAPTAKGKH